MHTKSLLSFIFSIVLVTLSYAVQGQTENLIRDTAFFQKQLNQYQLWLDKTGIGKTLRVADIQVEKDYLTLYLGFHAHNLDTIVNSWNQLKTQYETEQSLSIEAQLFFRMISLMGVRQDIACVKIYDTYNLSRSSLFNVIIYYDKGKLQIEKGGSKGEPLPIRIDKKDLSGAKKLSAAQFTNKYNRDYVFDKITEYLQNKYKSSPCDQRYPQVRRLPNEDYLKIEVSDLCREVIKNAENPTICDWLKTLGYKCNWTKRELLVFTFDYKQDAQGFKLILNLDAKVGSGYYDDIDRKGYFDMENDFKPELERYSNELVGSIKEYLKKQ